MHFDLKLIFDWEMSSKAEVTWRGSLKPKSFFMSLMFPMILSTSSSQHWKLNLFQTISLKVEVCEETLWNQWLSPCYFCFWWYVLEYVQFDFVHYIKLQDQKDKTKKSLLTPPPPILQLVVKPFVVFGHKTDGQVVEVAWGVPLPLPQPGHPHPVHLLGHNLQAEEPVTFPAIKMSCLRFASVISEAGKCRLQENIIYQLHWLD